MSTIDTPVFLSIVIPAYNEGQINISTVLNEITQTLAGIPWVSPYEILLIDDGSTDETGKIAEEFASANSNIKVHHHDINKGFGAALQTGFKNSTGKFVTILSSDGEIGIDQVLNLLNFASDVDLVISNRQRLGNYEWYRDVISFTWNILASLILGINMKGHDGIYIIRGDVIRNYHLSSNTGLINLEIYKLSRKRKIRIKDGIPMQTRPRISGKSKVTNPQTIIKTFFEMIKLRIRLIINQS